MGPGIPSNWTSLPCTRARSIGLIAIPSPSFVSIRLRSVVLSVSTEATAAEPIEAHEYGLPWRKVALAGNLKGTYTLTIVRKDAASS